MASNNIEENAEEGITAEEIAGDAPAVRPASSQQNAFKELMTPKKSPSKGKSKIKSSNPHSIRNNPELIPVPPRSITSFTGRYGLGEFLVDPAKFMGNERLNRVLYYTPSFVAIQDLYPKASVHTLLLPRDLKYSLMHPLLALSDEKFLAEIRNETANLKKLVASELKRKFGAVSKTEQARRDALAQDLGPSEEVPLGRDWEVNIMAGIHAGPSMTHMHVHVLSKDMVSDCMNHRKHYSSFNTPFFVQLDEFPLSDQGVHDKLAGRAKWLNQDPYICWRCGRNFGNKLKELKRHLAEELEVWKRE